MRINTALLLLVALALYLATSTAVPTPTTRWYELTSSYSFANYVAEFHKSYSPAEYSRRKAIFESRLATILAHNADTSSSYKMGVNRLTDLTDAELKGLRGYRKDITASRSKERLSKITYEFSDAKLQDFPTSVDWRTSGIISNVKDQGQCGSCWTFATASNLESYGALKSGVLYTLSEQQILDCTPNPEECGGTGGCQGGTAELAMDTLLKNHKGLATEWTYPYQSYQGNDFSSCGFNLLKTPVAFKFARYSILPSNEYTPLIAALQNGPIAISVDASAWNGYETGVFTGCAVEHPDIDHAVQLVGYGTDSKYGDYWIVRNSWSPSWGEDGYIRIARSSTPTCGVDISPLDGTGCKNGPANVTVCGDCGILYDNTFPTI